MGWVGTCTIRIQCSHRVEVTWGLMHTLATILSEGAEAGVR